MSIETLTSKGSYGSSGLLAVFGAWTVNEWATIIGIALAIGTFMINWFFKKKWLEETRRHNRKSRQIQKGEYEDCS